MFPDAKWGEQGPRFVMRICPMLTKARCPADESPRERSEVTGRPIRSRRATRRSPTSSPVGCPGFCLRVLAPCFSGAFRPCPNLSLNPTCPRPSNLPASSYRRTLSAGENTVKTSRSDDCPAAGRSPPARQSESRPRTVRGMDSDVFRLHFQHVTGLHPSSSSLSEASV